MAVCFLFPCGSTLLCFDWTGLNMWRSLTLLKSTSLSPSIKKERLKLQPLALGWHFAHDWRLCIWLQVAWMAVAVSKIRILTYPWYPHCDQWSQESTWKMCVIKCAKIRSRRTPQYRHQYNASLISESICNVNYFFISSSLLIFACDFFLMKMGLFFFQIVYLNQEPNKFYSSDWFIWILSLFFV